MLLIGNHKKFLLRLITALDFCDDVYVADGGSTDGSDELLKKFGAKVFYNKWTDDFPAQYKFLQGKMPKDEWIFRVDADELPTTALRETAKSTLQNLLPAKDTTNPFCAWIYSVNLVQDEQHYDENSLVMQARFLFNDNNLSFSGDQKIHPTFKNEPYGLRLSREQAIVHLAALSIPEIEKKREYYRKLGGDKAVDEYKLMHPDKYIVKPLPDFIKFI